MRYHEGPRQSNGWHVVPSTDFFYSFSGQLCLAANCSSLLGRVLHIVRLRSKKKVFWPNAIRDIAFMQDVLARRNRAMSQYP
jgi:hypothetical protein